MEILDNFEPTRTRSTNTLQQDLFLLAKGHYTTHQLDRFTAIKLILGVHVIAAKYIRDRDIIFLLMKEFYVPGIIMKNREDVIDILMNPGSIHNHSTPRPSKDELIIHDLMDRVSVLRVFEDGKWLMPFERSEPDPNVQASLDEYLKFHESVKVKVGKTS